jgi:hypothetical protein
MSDFKFDIAATLAATATKSVFVDTKKDTTFRLRFLPPNEDTNGNLWAMTGNHWGLKDEEGKNIAPACAGDDCFFCKLASYLQKSADPDEQELGKELTVSNYYYTQVLVATKVGMDEKDVPFFEYSEPKLIKMSPGAAKKVNALLKAQWENGDDLLFSEEGGHDFVLERSGEKKGTRYEVTPIGRRNNLDTIRPDWKDRRLNPWDHLRTAPMAAEEAMAVAVRTFGNTLDWDEINSVLGG